ncbi:HaeII family restriction endonuclease [Actinobacillus lignieresii]|uniref:HaeII restriction endonuclease n=1 Tax=Actinobacillus lignieresii TaxID=720 RepID=A0A380TWF4_ACTLI|nr:HaeII family restriction endonuclease [Actinobacillus lignieresii]SUT92323.1 HaeII restriction endonuclease [Actinobacillus lignieresii]
MNNAKKAIDNLIKKTRVHFYKPIQIAEILYRDRVYRDIDLANLETYRTSSKKWRDVICEKFIGRVSTSSARFQDDLFVNAITPDILVKLGSINRAEGGSVEKYIYKAFSLRLSQMSSAINYCEKNSIDSFHLSAFLNLFWSEPGLRRSLDKIYEIIVYSLFSALVEALEVSVQVSFNINKKDLFEEFSDFAQNVVQLSMEKPSLSMNARINRVGVTNAADRGLDMWANFGMAIQIKHLSLTEELAESIVSSVSSDRIVIVCKDSEEKVIVSLLNQIGWKSKIQSIITETNLVNWYEKALRGKYAKELGQNILDKIKTEIFAEFPVTNNFEFEQFLRNRNYYSVVSQDFI